MGSLQGRRDEALEKVGRAEGSGASPHFLQQEPLTSLREARRGVHHRPLGLVQYLQQATSKQHSCLARARSSSRQRPAASGTRSSGGGGGCAAGGRAEAQGVQLHAGMCVIAVSRPQRPQAAQARTLPIPLLLPAAWPRRLVLEPCLCPPGQAGSRGAKGAGPAARRCSDGCAGGAGSEAACALRYYDAAAGAPARDGAIGRPCIAIGGKTAARAGLDRCLGPHLALHSSQPASCGVDGTGMTTHCC